MTVTVQTNKNETTGDGVLTVFPFTFELLQSDDLSVFVNDVLQVGGYTVAINSSGVGGNITFASAPANAAAIIFLRDIDLTQETALPIEGNIPESTLETMSDKLTMIAQQIMEILNRAFTVPRSIATSFSMPLPDALKLLRWNAAADNLENVNAESLLVSFNPGAGNVVGPASSTTSRVALWSGTTGQLLKDGPTLGTSGHVLTSNGVGVDPSFQAVPTPANAAVAGLCRHRLTTESGVPISGSDRTAQSTIYLTPFTGNAIALSISGVWEPKETAEISLALSGLTSGKNYDVFAYWDSGTSTVKLELLVWTNDTTRATALVRDSGAWVKTGDVTRLYVGTIRTTGTTTTEDSAAKRYVYSQFNRVQRHLFAKDTTNTWTYTTATWRSANANTTAGTGRVECVTGVGESCYDASYHAISDNASASVFRSAGVGIDSTSSPSGIFQAAAGRDSGLAAHQGGANGIFSAGFHFIQSLEHSTASGTTTWYGDNGGAAMQSGLFARVEM